MRVLVATGAFKHLTSAQTGAAMARAWAELGVQCAVVPLAEAGKDFCGAWADLPQGTGEVALRFDADVPGVDGTSSAPVGDGVRAALEQAAARGCPVSELWLEVPTWGWVDGGAGFWHATRDHHETLRALPLHLVTTEVERSRHLTGLRGLTAATMHTSGAHPGELLAADQRLVDWCTQLGDEGLGTTEGAGAVGGLGAAVLALGGDVVTGPAELARRAGLCESMQRADVVVTGYDTLDFGSKGGDLVPVVTDLAEAAGRPVIALARRNHISARELRTMGIEQGYSLQRGDDAQAGPMDEAAITAACRAVASTWHW